MVNATIASGDISADRFYQLHVRDGRAALMSLPRSEAWGGTKGTDDPEMWLVRVGQRLVAVDDYDPSQTVGYLQECRASDGVWSIVDAWLAYRVHQRALKKAHRRTRAVSVAAGYSV